MGVLVAICKQPQSDLGWIFKNCFFLKEGGIVQDFIMGMWFEIIPSFAIMVGIYTGGDALQKLYNKLVYGVKQERDVANSIDMALWKRDYQHSYPAWNYAKWHGSPYRGHG